MTPMRIRYSLLMAFAWVSAWGFGQDPSRIRETYFPDPDTVFTTPAFESKRGFTTSQSMLAFLDDVARPEAGWMRDTIGRSGNGTPIIALRIQGEATSAERLRVLMIGGIHGNEPAGTEGLLAMIQHLGDGGDWMHLIQGVELRIVPMLNPDGMDRQLRNAANNLDLNRDQSKVENIEMIALKQYYNAFDADVVIDLHEYRPYRADYVQMGQFGVTSPFDVMFMYTGNLNVPEPIRRASEQILVNPARAAMDRSGRKYANYFRPIVIRGERQFRSGGTSPRSTVTSFGLASSLSVLMEIRGVGLGRKGFERRVETAMLLCRSFLESCSTHPDEIRAARKAGQNDRSPVVIDSERASALCEIELLDLQSETIVEFRERCVDSNNQTPSATRSFPVAYVLLPSEAKAAEKLSILGLHVEQLDIPTDLTVEAYSIESNRLSPEEFEGFYERIVKTTTQEVPFQAPAGSFLISADQPRFHLTKELLEPEADNGFVRFRIIEPSEDGSIPIFRVPRPYSPFP